MNKVIIEESAIDKLDSIEEYLESGEFVNKASNYMKNMKAKIKEIGEENKKSIKNNIRLLRNKDLSEEDKEERKELIKYITKQIASTLLIYTGTFILINAIEKASKQMQINKQIDKEARKQIVGNLERVNDIKNQITENKKELEDFKKMIEKNKDSIPNSDLKKLSDYITKAEKSAKRDEEYLKKFQADFFSPYTTDDGKYLVLGEQIGIPLKGKGENKQIKSNIFGNTKVKVLGTNDGRNKNANFKVGMDLTEFVAVPRYDKEKTRKVRKKVQDYLDN